MGTICGKNGKEESNRSFTRKKVCLKRPDLLTTYTRKKEWIGFKNLHNTCYINSVLQCLAANNDFMGYLTEIQGLDPRTLTQDLKNELFEHKEAPTGPVVPQTFIDSLFKTFNDFEKGRQEDAHELLMKLFDQINIETKNKNISKNVIPNKKNVSVKMLWQNYLKSHGSLVSEVFEGLQKVRTKCAGCQTTSVKHETFSMLSLSLGKQETQLSRLLVANFEIEKLTDKDSLLMCDKCKTKQKANKVIRLVHLPETFIITLNRFEYDPKIHNFVKIDREIFYEEVCPLSKNISHVAVKMELFAVIVASYNLVSNWLDELRPLLFPD